MKLTEDDSRYKPYFIYVVTGIQVIMVIVSIIINKGFEPMSENFWLGPSTETLLKLGAKDSPLMREGEWWRFITPIFLHTGIGHLAMNMSFQLRVARILNEIYGQRPTAIIYMLSGIGGNLASAIFDPEHRTVGASTSLFGLLGVLFVDLLQNWWNLAEPEANLKSLGGSLVLAIGMGFLPWLDNFAHIGGMIVGVLAGVIFLPTITFGKAHAQWKATIVCWAIPTLGVYLVTMFFLFYNNYDAAASCPKCFEVNCLQVLFPTQCGEAATARGGETPAE